MKRRRTLSRRAKKRRVPRRRSGAEPDLRRARRRSGKTNPRGKSGSHTRERKEKEKEKEKERKARGRAPRERGKRTPPWKQGAKND